MARARLQLVVVVLLAILAHSAHGSYSDYVYKLDSFRTIVARNVDTNTQNFKNFDKEIDNAKERGKGEDDSKLEKVSEVLNEVIDSVGSVTSDDPLAIVQGSLQIASSFVSLAGPVGGVIGGIFSVAANFLTLFMTVDSTPTLEETLTKIIEQALKKYEDSEIKSNANGHKRIIQNCKGGLDRLIPLNKSASEGELAAIHGTCFPKELTHFLGYMEEKIKESAKDASKPGDTEIEPQERAMQRVRIYTDMGGLRDLILIQLLSYYTIQKAESLLEMTLGWLEAEQVTDKRILTSYLTQPSLEYVGLAAYYDPREEPTVAKYVAQKKVPDNVEEFNQRFCTNTFQMYSERYKNLYAKVNANGNYWYGSNEPSPVLTACSFIYIPEALIGSICLGTRYCMGEGDWPWIDISNSRWKFLKLPDGKYLILSVFYEVTYMCTSKDNHRKFHLIDGVPRSDQTECFWHITNN